MWNLIHSPLIFFIYILCHRHFTGKAFPNPPHLKGSSSITLSKHPVLLNSTYHSLNNFFVYFKFIFPLGCNVHIHFVATPVFLIHYRQSIIFEDWNEGRKEWEEVKIQSKHSYRHTPCAPNGTVSTFQNSVWSWLTQCLLGFRVSEIQVWKRMIPCLLSWFRNQEWSEYNFLHRWRDTESSKQFPTWINRSPNPHNLVEMKKPKQPDTCKESKDYIT